MWKAGSERQVAQLLSSSLETQFSHESGGLASFELVRSGEWWVPSPGAAVPSVTTWVASVWAGFSWALGRWVCLVCQAGCGLLHSPDAPALAVVLVPGV